MRGRGDATLRLFRSSTRELHVIAIASRAPPTTRGHPNITITWDRYDELVESELRNDCDSLLDSHITHHASERKTLVSHTLMTLVWPHRSTQQFDLNSDDSKYVSTLPLLNNKPLLLNRSTEKASIPCNMLVSHKLMPIILLFHIHDT